MKVQGQRCNCRVIQIVSQNVPAEEDRGAETKFEIHGAENYFTHWTNKLFRKDPVLINTQSKQKFSHVSIYLEMQLVQLKNTYYVLKKNKHNRIYQNPYVDITYNQWSHLYV